MSETTKGVDETLDAVAEFAYQIAKTAAAIMIDRGGEAYGDPDSDDVMAANPYAVARFVVGYMRDEDPSIAYDLIDKMAAIAKARGETKEGA